MQPVRQTIRHVVIGLGAVLVAIVSGYVILANSDAYKTARRYLATHPRVIAALGEGIETRLAWGGRFRVNLAEADRQMRLVLVAKGRKAAGTATIELSREKGAPWTVQHAELSLPEGELDLRAPIDTGPGPATAAH